MLKSILFSLFTLFAIVTFAQPPAGDAKVGDYYGKKPKSKGASKCGQLDMYAPWLADFNKFGWRNYPDEYLVQLVALIYDLFICEN